MLNDDEGSREAADALSRESRVHACSPEIAGFMRCRKGTRALVSSPRPTLSLAWTVRFASPGSRLIRVIGVRCSVSYLYKFMLDLCFVLLLV